MMTAIDTKLVCIAEDNPDLQSIFGMVFEHAAFRTVTVSDGRQALACIQQDTPDLLVVDVNMPYVSGLEVLRRVRQNPQTAQMQVIVVTGNTQALTTPEAALADLVLVKPVDVFELRTFVERFLNIHR